MSVRPTFMGFETAKRGIMVSQKGMDVVGHNLSNIRTQGYTRQRVDVYAVSPNRYASRFGNSRTDTAGQGVDTGGVSQIRDSFLDKRFREEYGDVGYYNKSSQIMDEIEAALSEYGLNPDEENPMGTGLQNALQEILNDLENFGREGDSKTNANIVLTTFKNMTQLLHQINGKLDNVAEQTKFDMEIATDEVNSILRQVANLNYNISQDMSVTKASNGEYYGPNELLDQRNFLLDQLAAYGNIDVKNMGDGNVTVKMNGHTVVEGKDYEMLNFSRNTNGTVELKWQSDGKNVDLQTGSLKAFQEMINGRGINAHLTNEVTTNGVRYYKDKLNAFASTFSNAVNNILPKMDNGTPPQPIPGQFRSLIESSVNVKQPDGTYISVNTYPVTAANISISGDWLNDASYIIYEDKNMTDLYIREMKSSLETGEFTFRGTGEIGNGTFKGTFFDFVQDYVTGQASERAFSDQRLSATTEIAESLLDRRDEISGVSEDEETVNMMMYQKSLNAASRLFTTLDEALDTIINKTGIVGR